MKIKLIVTFVLIFLSQNLVAQAWSTFTTDNSTLKNNIVNSIAISEDGTVWFATNDGLASYFKGKWSGYSTDNGLSSNKLNSVSINPLNSANLLIGSDSGVTIVDVDSTGFTSQPEFINKSVSEILSDTILTTNIDGFDNNWVGTDKGLSIITNSGIYSFNEENGFRHTNVNTIKILAENWAHIGTSGGGVSRLKYNGVDGITSASDIVTTWSMLPSDTVLSIYVTDDTLRWFGTTQGVATHFGERTKDGPITEGGSWWIYDISTSEIIDNYVKAITQDNEGNMWFGTRKGLSKLSVIDNTWNSYTENDGLVSNNIFDIKVDNDNNIWVATDKGVSLLSDISTSVSDNYLKNNYKINISNYPNPFNPATTIKYSLPTNDIVKISLFNSNGELIETLLDEFKLEGEHTLRWDSTLSNNNSISSGVYFIVIESNRIVSAKKILLLK